MPLYCSRALLWGLVWQVLHERKEKNGLIHKSTPSLQDLAYNKEYEKKLVMPTNKLSPFEERAFFVGPFWFVAALPVSLLAPLGSLVVIRAYDFSLSPPPPPNLPPQKVVHRCATVREQVAFLVPTTERQMNQAVGMLLSFDRMGHGKEGDLKFVFESEDVLNT
jgi:hypothetical protein